LVPTWVTSNDLERRNGPYFALFHRIGYLWQAYYVTVIEDRPILSAEYHLPLLPKTDQPCSAVSLR